VNESLPELIPFNQQVHQVLSDARPQTPGIFRFAARMDSFEGAGCARPRPIPDTESALGLRSSIALSSAQVLPEWTTSTSPCNNFPSNGDNPLNFVSHVMGSLHTGSCQ
jgi:hypothetical protein